MFCIVDICNKHSYNNGIPSCVRSSVGACTVIKASWGICDRLNLIISVFELDVPIRLALFYDLAVSTVLCDSN